MEGPPTEAALALHMMLCMFGQLATAGRSQDKPAWHWIACSFRPSFGFFGSLPADLSQSMDGAATRASAWVTRARPCVRCVLCSPAFLLVPALGSTGSAAGCPALFVGFTATMAESDFPRSCIIGFGSSPSRCGPEQHALQALPAGRGTSRFPYKKLLHMPGSATTLGRPGAR